MTTTERDYLTNLCKRILGTRDRGTFNQCVEEMRLFLETVLPVEESKAELPIATC